MRLLWLTYGTFLLTSHPAFAKEPACSGTKTRTVWVDTSTHRLTLCDSGKSEKDFTISIGKSGVDKNKEGDHKTPLGKYPLSLPRPSQKFSIFIPIGYPTPDQKRLGFTGAAVGIHGPPRWIAWFGAVTRLFDWTDGCLAVGTDREIEEISNWVRESKSVEIWIQGSADDR